MEKDIHRLLSDIDVRTGLKNFKKNRYESFFNAYRNDLSDVYSNINKLYDMDDKEEALNEAALSLVSWAKDTYDSTGRFSKEQKLLDMQCMMVFYVLPGILANGHEDDRALTDSIVGQWRAAFAGSKIEAATYDELYGGFRDTIFGFNIENIFQKK